jgi:glycogen synthase
MSRRIIIHTPEPRDGAAQYVSELVVALAGIGLPVLLFCPANFEYARKVREAGVSIVPSPARIVSSATLPGRLLRNMKFLWGAAWAQFRLTRHGDVFHFQNILHLPLGFVFYLLVKLQGGSIVLTAHDPVPHRWRFPEKLRWLERSMLAWSYRMCQKIIVHNEIGKEILMREFGTNPDRIVVIPHGPYTPAANEKVAYPEFDCLNLLAFGAIRENKGLHLAIEAVQSVNRISAIPVHLTIAGKVHTAAEEQYWSYCKELIARTPEFCEIHQGYVPDNEVTALMARHHAVIQPYLDFFSESGVAALALSHERPILATSAGGLGELLQEGLAGISIKAPTSQAVADAIQVALNLGPRALLQKGIAGKKFVNETRSWHSIARQTAQVYAELAHGTPDELIERPDTFGAHAQMPQRLFIHTPEPVSSPALYIDALSRALTAEGVPVHIICPENHQALEVFQRNPLITVHTTAVRGTDGSTGIFGKLLGNLRFLLLSCGSLLRNLGRSDTVHFQYGLHLPFGALLFLCAKSRGSQIVFTAHDPMPHKWMMPAMLRWIEKGALAWIYKVSDVIIVHSESGKRTILENFSIAPAKLKVIAHGTYELGIDPAPMPASERLEVLLFGALRENKGAHLAIQAVQRMHREGAPVRLTIAGAVLNRKEQRYWNYCRALIEANPDPINVQEGFVPDDKIPEIIAGCHCFLLPYTSFYSDSGVAFLALPNGRPIVSTKAGGLGELLASSGGGIVISGPTVEDIVEALWKAKDMGKEGLGQLGRAGAAWVLKECGWPKVARETRRVYESLYEEQLISSSLALGPAKGGRE